MNRVFVPGQSDVSWPGLVVGLYGDVGGPRGSLRVVTRDRAGVVRVGQGPQGVGWALEGRGVVVVEMWW